MPSCRTLPTLALAELETLLSIPSRISIPLLDLELRWAPLREHPRYGKLKLEFGRPAMAGEQATAR